MGVELYANYPNTTVTSGGTTAPSSGTVESWTVASSVTFPAASSTNGTTFHVSDPALPTELILITNVSGTTWTATRGAEGTTPVAHTSGFTVKQVVSAGVLGSFQVLIPPSGDATGATDTAAIAAAYTAGQAVALQSGGTYYVGAASSSANGITVPVPGVLDGHASTVKYLGTGGAGIYWHGSGPTANYPANMGYIRDVVVDGTTAGAGSIGVDYGDGKNTRVQNVHAQNFTASGSIGHHVNNVTGWTEKATIDVSAENCAVAVQFDVQSGASSSFMYSSWEFRIYVNGGQTGVVVNKGNIQNFRRFVLYGNLFANTNNPANAAVLDISGNGSSNPRISTGHVEIHVETDTPATTTWYPIRFGSNGAMFGCSGSLAFLDSGAWNAPDLGYGQFQFGGPIIGNLNSTSNLIKYNMAPPNWAPQAAASNTKQGASTQYNGTNLAFVGVGATYTPQSSGTVKGDLTGFAVPPSSAVQLQLGCRYGVAAQQFTATQASPAVFTATTAGYTNGTQVVLAATGTGNPLPGGFSAATTYYVVSASGLNFSLAATLGGAGINSSSAGSGTVQYAFGNVTPSPSQSFTATLASPCVFTPATNSFVNNTQVYLTGSSLPTGFTANTLYFVVNSTSTTFELATSAGGTPINSTGSGSGNVVQAASGTRWGSSTDPNILPANTQGEPFAFNDVMSLTATTEYWADAVYSSSSATTNIQLKNISISLMETA